MGDLFLTDLARTLLLFLDGVLLAGLDLLLGLGVEGFLKLIKGGCGLDFDFHLWLWFLDWLRLSDWFNLIKDLARFDFGDRFLGDDDLGLLNDWGLLNLFLGGKGGFLLLFGLTEGFTLLSEAERTLSVVDTLFGALVFFDSGSDIFDGFEFDAIIEGFLLLVDLDGVAGKSLG